ncbi:hypothetical protein IAT38_006840 [Cryptococcus sp. DSM 104549]
MAKGPIYLPVTSSDAPEPQVQGGKRRWPLVALGLLATSAVLTSWPLSVSQFAYRDTEEGYTALSDDMRKGLCAQAEPILPEGYNTSKIWEEKDVIIKRLQEAVRIPTEIFDEMGPVDEDPRWQIFTKFHAFLEETFPLIYKVAEVTKTDWALVYEIAGSDPSLKPIFLTAHQDVVPVLPSTRDQWIHDPYGGEYDGTVIHGRGAADTKSSLIAVMSAIEHLLKTTDFKPKRTIILGFGSDEERGGQVGAPAISRYLTEKYGPDSMALLIDEGSGMINTWGQQFATPGVAEKGHYDLDITVSTLGGHSSVPPPHTAIGLISLLIAELEAHPHSPSIAPESPVYEFMTCAAAYAGEMPGSLKSLVVKAEGGDLKAWDSLPEEIIKYGLGGAPAGPGQGDPIKSMLSTTQAVDIINGGLKVNALPESVTAVVNHRVNVLSDHLDLQTRTLSLLLPLCKSLNLTLIDFSGEIAFAGSPTSKVSLSNAYGYYTDPSPHSPVSVEDPAWRVMAGTARGIWASRAEVSEDGTIVELKDGEDLVMAPLMSTGNTDTRRYWGLTRNIYRFRYTPMAGSAGAHTINEYANAHDLVEFARFYQAMILNLDQAGDVA